jgi:hypothetical protein
MLTRVLRPVDSTTVPPLSASTLHFMPEAAPAILDADQGHCTANLHPGHEDEEVDSQYQDILKVLSLAIVGQEVSWGPS